MLKWEIKKLFKEKYLIFAGLFFVLALVIVGFAKPLLETQNEYFDQQKNEYIIDKREKKVIANEKLKQKRQMITEAIQASDGDKTLEQLSKNKLKADKQQKYEDVAFYQVFAYRIDFSVAMIVMMIITVMLVSQLYTNEVIAHVAPILLAAKERKKALFAKVGLATIIPIVVYRLYIASAWLITFIQYGKPVNSQLPAYRIIDAAMLAKEMTIEQYVHEKIMTSLLILLSVSLITMFISFISNQSIKAMSLSVAFVILGKVIVEFDCLPQTLQKIVGTGNYVDVLTNQTKISGFYNGQITLFAHPIDLSRLIMMSYGVIAVLGLVGCCYMIKKGLTK